MAAADAAAGPSVSDDGGTDSLARVAEELKRRGRDLGLSLVGIASVEPSEHLEFYRSWIERGFHGEMGYLAREGALARRGDLSRTLEGIRSAVVVADPYDQPDPPGVPEDPSRGVIARYARGRDYHKVLKKKLIRLARWLDREVPTHSPTRAYVDTGPVLERELARRAGLGWFGRNTMLIHPRQGSYFFLGVLLTDVPLPPDPPFETDHCGSCTRCIEACPTDALLGRDESGAPVLDARRCISYLTIEHRSAIPHELREAMGNRVFGCDICQEVCPWNERFSPVSTEAEYAVREGVAPTTDGPALIDLVRMSEEAWDAYTRGSAMRRAGYSGLRRNVAIALGNWLAVWETPDEEAVGALKAAASAADPVVAEAAGWGLGRT